MIKKVVIEQASASLLYWNWKL